MSGAVNLLLDFQLEAVQGGRTGRNGFFLKMFFARAKTLVHCGCSTHNMWMFNTKQVMATPHGTGNMSKGQRKPLRLTESLCLRGCLYGSHE